jgi:S-DNA-T family DNA segregation ATPase FtsK/SpoIIIE
MLPPVPQDDQRSSAGSTAMTMLLPIMSSIALAAYMISNGKPVLIIVGLSFVLCSVGAGVLMSQRSRGGRRKTRDRQRARYLDHLAEVRQTARQVAADQRFAAAWVYPSPERLWAIARRRRRVWERRRADPDFLRVRLGLGQGPLAAPVQLSQRMDPLADYDPQILAAAQRHAARLGVVGRQPLVVDLGSAAVVSLSGRPDLVRALARALVLQVAVLHAPDDLGLIVRTAGEPSWEWTKWLPHTHEPHTIAAAGVAPLVAAEISDLACGLEAALEQGRAARHARRSPFDLARGEQAGRRLLVVLDSYDPAAHWARLPVVAELLEEAGPETGITVVCLPVHESGEPSGTRVRARVAENGGLTVEGPGAGGARDIECAVADQVPAELAEMIGRALAPLRLSDEPERLLSRTIALAQMLGVADLAAFDPTGSWLPPGDDDVLRVPVGLASDGEPVLLDLKESAAGGMGPHGLVVGATGSGKSELLRTLVTALAVMHSPELLSLVLIDFKGGATFAGLTELPHVAGLITNLADDLTLVERVRAALHGEQQRRQKLLRQAGNADSLRDYQLRRAAGYQDAAGKPLEPLPYLLIVVDEFGELLSQRNDFIDLFVQIGRVGRSLGMHLLLATQRLDEGRLRGLESHLSYRICLRTFTSGESRAVIGTTEAYQLPPIPGSAFLKVGDSSLLRFRVACMSGPYEGPEPTATETRAVGIVPFELRGTGLRGAGPMQGAVPDQDDGRPARSASMSEPTALHVAAAQLARFGQPVHQVWLPPLPAVVPLDALLGPLALQPQRGWQASLWPGRGRLTFPVGLIDLPFQQRQEPFLLDFARTHGNLAVIGAPQSGKSTFLRTVMLSAMLTHTPDEIRFYCLDFGGSTLGPLGGAPHVGTVAGRRDPDLAVRLIAEMLRLVAAREQLFAERGIESVAAFRGLGATGLPAGTYTGEILVVVDNWGAIRADIEDADAAIADLAFRGLGVGVHVILTANRWADVRMNVRDGFGARLELRLNDPTESEVSRPLSRQLPVAVPGRGLVPPGLLFHAVAPRLDGRDTLEDLTAAQDEVVTKIAASWSGASAHPIQLLPSRVHADDLGLTAGGSGGSSPRASIAGGSGGSSSQARTAADSHGVLIGLADTDLQPVRLDLSAADPHLVVVGDAGAGKSVLLRTLMRGLASRHRVDEIRFMLVDYRRSLLDVVPDDYVGAYAGDSVAAREYATLLAGQLAGRLPPAGITARELRARGWWSGPDLYLVIDDYDLVTTAPPSPLAVIADYIPQAREIGLHVLLARRVSGMSRVTVADQLLTRIRDLGTSGIVLSGDPREGIVLGGERAAIRPPGRGTLIRRSHPSVLVQAAISDYDS